jgi:hypothetical protein
LSAEVRCTTHGTFAYKSAECPGCKRPRPTYEERKEEERKRWRALREDENVRGMLFLLERRHGIEHVLGEVGQTYHGVLLGAVDIAERRYACLHRKALEEVVCVPWIDAFAEWIGEKIVVEWSEREPKADHFSVSERDGALSAPKEAEEEPAQKLRTLRAMDAETERATNPGDALRRLLGAERAG